MPIYEYRCDSCGHYLDVLQRLADEPLRECPECSGSLRRLMSAPSFRLKGAGWYETDFKSDNERKRNLAEGAAEKSDSGQSSDDKKPADKGADKAGADKAGTDKVKAGADKTGTDKAGADRSASDKSSSKEPSEPKKGASPKGTGTEAA